MYNSRFEYIGKTELKVIILKLSIYYNTLPLLQACQLKIIGGGLPAQRIIGGGLILIKSIFTCKASAQSRYIRRIVIFNPKNS